MAYETTDQLLTLPSHHWYKEHDGNLYKLLNVFNGDLERISDFGDKVAKWRGIFDAEGTTLDLFGKDISTYRPTKSDPPYRFLIYLKTLLARAQGTIPSIVKITGEALGTRQGLKIWKTGPPRHIAIQIPWDYVSELPVEKFLLENLQHMLALGYWLDYIVFRADTPLKLYIGVGTQDRWQTTARSKTIWWTGWKTKTQSNLYYGMHTSYKNYQRVKSNVSWWTGWKAQTSKHLYLAVIGRIADTSIWHTSVSWSSNHKEEVHAGLSVGTKTITTTTQSIKTE